MKNRQWKKLGAAVGAVLGTAVIVFAITNLFSSKSERSPLSKKTVFQFDLSTDMTAAEVGPGDSFTVRPVIFNDATTEMYVFVVLQMPLCNDSPIYTYDVASDWTEVSEKDGEAVYAYAGSEMTALQPGESTTALTEQMTMKQLTNAEYSQIDDINITVTGYAIGTEEVSTTPAQAWEQCKAIGNIE